MRYIIYLFWFSVVILGVIFASLNPSAIDINYYFNESHIHLPILLLLTLLMGTLLGMIAMLPNLAKAKHFNRRLKNKVKKIEQEITNLRTLPIKDEHL